MNLSTINTKKIFWLTFFGILIAWAMGNIPSIINFKVLYTHADWKLAQYNVNYFDHGFIRRGFVGTILFPFMSNSTNQPEVQKIFIFWKETILFVIYSSIFCYFIYIKTSKVSTFIRLSLISCLILSPLGLIEAAYDFGRYDHINFILLALSLFFLQKNKYILVSFLLALCVLIHENSIFYIHPLVTAISVRNLRNDYFKAIKILLPSFIISILIYFFGDKPVLLPEALSFGSILDGASIWGIGTELYLHRAWSETNPLNIFIFLSYTLMSFSLLFQFYRSNRLNIDLNFLSCLTPLMLFIIASDYGRWVHYIFINVLIVICYKLNHLRKISFNKTFFSLIFLLSVPLGAIGIGSALPYINLVINRLT